MGFLEEIKLSVRQKMRPNRLDRIKKVLKLTTVFFVMYRSLFREHEGQELTKEHLLGFMKVLEKFLKGLGQEESLRGCPEDSVEMIWHDLIHSRPRKANSDQDLSLAWKTVEYWTKEKEKASNPIGSSAVNGDISPSIRTLIQKIVYYSNLKTIYKPLGS
jgi:hypothetical protein